MTPEVFVKSIYLGDRGIDGIMLELKNRDERNKIDCISRVRGDSWSYYTDEDVENGTLLFRGVTKFSMQPHGPLPSEFIGDFTVVAIDDERVGFNFQIKSGALRDDLSSVEVTIGITASSIAIIDPRYPDVLIVD